MFSLGLEPRTFRVWGERDNHYTTKTCCKWGWKNNDELPFQFLLSVTYNSDEHSARMKKSAKKFGRQLLFSPEFCLHCSTSEGVASCFLGFFKNVTLILCKIGQEQYEQNSSRKCSWLELKCEKTILEFRGKFLCWHMCFRNVRDPP